jgi:hypothetical protein
MSGRVAAIDGVNSNPDILYVGARDRRRLEVDQRRPHLAPIFDDQPVHAIGSIAIVHRTPSGLGRHRRGQRAQQRLGG